MIPRRLPWMIAALAVIVAAASGFGEIASLFVAPTLAAVAVYVDAWRISGNPFSDESSGGKAAVWSAASFLCFLLVVPGIYYLS